MCDTVEVKCAFLYNPNSGKGKIREKAEKIGARLEGMFGEVAVRETGSAAEMEAQARDWARRADVLVLAGGDGTLQAALPGLIGSGVTLGYLPTGTSNDTAGNLHLPKNVWGALDVIGKKHAETRDCLAINAKRYAFSIVAAGAVTRLTYDTPQKNKRRFGWFAYAAVFAKRLLRATPFFAEITCGGRRAEGDFALVLILNGSKVARFSVGKGESMQDGMCEVVAVRQFGSGFRARCGAGLGIVRLLLFGTKKSGKRILRMRGRRVTVRKTDSVLWDFDGERGIEGEIDVRVLPHAVKVFVPHQEKNKNLRENA